MIGCGVPNRGGCPLLGREQVPEKQGAALNMKMPNAVHHHIDMFAAES